MRRVFLLLLLFVAAIVPALNAQPVSDKSELEKERQQLETQLDANLIELGFRV